LRLQTLTIRDECVYSSFSKDIIVPTYKACTHLDLKYINPLVRIYTRIYRVLKTKILHTFYGVDKLNIYNDSDIKISAKNSIIVPIKRRVS